MRRTALLVYYRRQCGRPPPGFPYSSENCGVTLCGDKKYISEPLKLLPPERGVEFLTKLKKNMKPKEISLTDKILLRDRAIIETVFDQLRNISQIEHPRHRSFWNFLGNIIAGLAAYSWREKKPGLNYNVKKLGLVY